MDGDAPLGFLEEDDQGNERDGDGDHDGDAGPADVALSDGVEEGGEAGDDAGEDDQGDAVADAFFGDQFAEPDEEHGAGGHGDDGGDGGEPLIGAEADAGDGAGVFEQDELSIALDDGHGDGEPVGVELDAVAAGFAFLGESLEFGDHGLEEVHHDRGGDVGVDAEGDDREVVQPTAGEEVEEAEDWVVVEGVFELGFVDVGDGHVRNEPEDHQHGEGEGQLLADVRLSPGVDQRLQQLRPGRARCCLRSLH